MGCGGQGWVGEGQGKIYELILGKDWWQRWDRPQVTVPRVYESFHC